MTNLEMIKYILQGYLKDYFENCQDWSVEANETEQSVKINVQKDKQTDFFLMLRMGVSLENEEIYIYNIYLPAEDRGKGLGLGIINVLFQLCEMTKFSLVLHSMTNSFYDAMLRRGASKTTLHDALHVTSETNLSVR